METLSVKSMQIGDWVKWEYISYPNVVRNNGYKQVAAIHSDDSVDLMDEDTLFEQVPMDEVKAVELTAEILEKNGFRKRKWESNSYVNSESEAAYICFSIGDYTNFWGGGDQDYVWVTVKYVHQLQHALRLCGIEKTIEL